MNKYQKIILNNLDIKLFSKDLDKDIYYDIDADDLSIYQDENYNITKYNLILKSESLKSVEIYDETWDIVKGYINTYNIEIDFNKQIRKIRLIFNDNIVDPITLNVNYIYSSRDDYDLILKEKNEDMLNQKACIRVTTGNNLINVLFQPVNDDYSYTKVELYSYMDNKPLIMARYKVSDDLFFLPIKDLAYGTYKIKVYEYDCNHTVIYESPFYLVTLQRPLRNTNSNYDR